MVKQPAKIANKMKRGEIYQKYKTLKKASKKKDKQKKKQDIEALGEAAPPKQLPRTIENTRVSDETTVLPGDGEVLGDEVDDEFNDYYINGKKPKIMITTRPKCSKKLFSFIGDLMQMIPNAFYYPRGLTFFITSK